MIIWRMEEYWVYESIIMLLIGCVIYVGCKNRRKSER